MSTEIVNQQVQELEKLRRQTRRTNLAIVVGITVIVLTGVGAIIGSARSLATAGPRQDEFLKQLGGRVQAEVIPTARHVIEPSLKRLGPAVETELQNANARAPQVVSVALDQLNTLGNSLTGRSQVILNETVGKELQQREVRLKRLYPGVTDAQINILVQNVQAELADQLDKTGEKIFTPHMNSIQNILTAVDTIRQSEHVDATREINPWQVTFLFLDVFTQEFHDLALNDTANNQEIRK